MLRRGYPTLPIHAGYAFLFGAIMTFSPSSVSRADGKITAVPEAREFEGALPIRIPYLVHYPQDSDVQDSDRASQPGRTWPLLLFLHGAGERGSDLDRVTIHGPSKWIAAGGDFPMFLVSPQCAAGDLWQPRELSALLDHLAETLPVDQDRIYVTGLSMGGFGTWALARLARDRVAAIAPICGGGETYWASDIKHIPAWVFHGAKDEVVPVRRSEEMVRALRQAGADVRLTVYPDAGHDSWTATYANPEFYQWLLSHKRSR